ncbi:hypothetical protein QBC40DRAFT_36628 [Triangularia verruculosa]|uniref:NACHT domain-containing protein n=1 Tax=Triangularia verruculosa TaxID=2587418 RepID=A0AAN7B0P3_9PEZI|nr:hypothetical protein QBC40DRAFT_36628 [Triangularia verruculosa]
MDSSASTSPPDDPFRAALSRFQQSLTDKERKDFEGCTLQDVKDAIKSIENRLASKRNQRCMQLISKFLEGMNQLGQVVEVFLNVDAMVAFVWGPIKFVLLIAATWVDTLDCLLDTYSEIGEILPGLAQYRKLLPGHPHIRVHLENYYCDVLEFHRKALDVFARPSWKVVFHSSWKTFKTHFGGTLAKLKRHRDLLADEKLTATMSEVLDSRQSIEDILDQLSRKVQDLHLSIDENEVLRQQETLNNKRQFVLSKLDPPRYHDDFVASFSERRSGTSGDWILNNDTFSHWADIDNLESRYLYLSGIPGAGKTILSSRVTHHLQQLSQNHAGQGATFPVIYFFFKHAQPDKRTITAFLLSLLSQLASHDEVSLDLVYQQLLPLDQQRLRTVSLLRELTTMVLRTHRLCFIIADGLDECIAEKSLDHEEVQGEVVSFLESLSPTENPADSPSRPTAVRVFVAGQRNGFLDKRLSNYPTIQLEATNAHAQDIDDYSQAKASEIQTKFKIPDSARTDLVHRVNSVAQGEYQSSKDPAHVPCLFDVDSMHLGMFLYAKIVLDNLLRQPSRGHFKRELMEENFPRGLDQAYDRVIVHILENPDMAQRDASRRILELVLCAKRPLRWKEIQSHFCVDLKTHTADPDFQLVEPCKHYCSSLVEVFPNRHSIGGSDDVVEIVHETARGYLFQTGRFVEASLNASMALFCAQYLNSDPFKLHDNESGMKEYCQTGFYSFVDYAAAYWWKHASALVAPGGQCQAAPEHQVWVALASLAGNLKSTQMPDTPISSDMSTISSQFRLLANDAREWENEFPIEFHVQAVRACVETILANDDFGEIMSDTDDPGDPRRLYGALTYKCSKPWCLFFQQGFDSSATRDKHVQEHERPFRCTSEGCYGHTVGFANEQDFKRHNDRVHPADDALLEFPAFPSAQVQALDIFQAVKNNDLATVRDFVQSGVDVRIPNTAGYHALFLAAQSKHHRMCEYLLDVGAKVNARNSKGGKTALHAAVAKDDFEVAQLLISRGADIFARDKAGKSLVPTSTDSYDRVYKAFPKHFFTHAMCEQDLCHVIFKSEELFELSVLPAGSGQELEDYQQQLFSLEKQSSRRLNKANLRRMISNEFTLPMKFLTREESCLDLTYIALNSFIEGIVKRRNVFVIALFESGRMDMDITDSKGRLPLHYACESINQPIFERILSLTTDLTVRDKDGKRAIDLLYKGMHGAPDTQPPEISLLMKIQLLRCMSLVDDSCVDGMHQLLQRVSAKPRSPGRLLEYACSSKQTDLSLLEMLLEDLKEQLQEDDVSRALHCALKAEMDHLIGTLLKHCPPSVFLYYACYTLAANRPSGATILKGLEGQLTKDDQFKAIFFAFGVGDYDALRVQLNHYDPGLPSTCLKLLECARTPKDLSAALYAAVKDEDIIAVRMLLEYRELHLRAEYHDGENVAIAATFHEDPQILRLLQRYDGSIFEPNSQGVGPLHCAAYLMNVEALKVAIAAEQHMVNLRVSGLPEAWLQDLAFGQQMLRSLGDDLTYEGILSRTPLFIAMNRAVHEADSTITSASQSTTNISANTPRFNAIFEAVMSVASLDLSASVRYATRDIYYLEAYLVYRCCDYDMVTRLASAGFVLEFAWELFKWIPGNGETPPHVMLSRRRFSDPEYDKHASRLSRLDLILAVVHNNRCRFVDIISRNLPFATALLHSGLLERGKVNFKDSYGPLLDILNSDCETAILPQMMMLGLDGQELLLLASGLGRKKAADMLRTVVLEVDGWIKFF